VNDLLPHDIQCPYCWENFEILVDGSVPHQRYIEDCEICCRPIEFDVRVEAEGGITVTASHEND